MRTHSLFAKHFRTQGRAVRRWVFVFLGSALANLSAPDGSLRWDGLAFAAEPAAADSLGSLGTFFAMKGPLAPPLDSLVAEILSRSPSLEAMRARLEAAREMEGAARALPDPMIGFMLQDVGFPRITVGDEEMSMLGAEVEQSFPWPGKLRARRAAAEAETDVRAFEAETLERELIRSARTLYGRIYALDGELRAMASAREVLQLLTSGASSRYSAGEGEQEAVIKAQLSLSRLEERIDDSIAERAATVASLNALRDDVSSEPFGEVRDLPEAIQDRPAGRGISNSPEVRARQAAARAAELRLAVARTELRPNLTTGAAYGWRGSFDPVVTLRVGVEVPLWQGRSQQPEIRAAEQELRMARAELREAEAAARADSIRLAVAGQRADRQVRRYEEAILPQSRAALDAARSSYFTGRGDFSTVAEDFEIWLDALSSLAGRQAERLEIWAETEALLSPQRAAASNTDSPKGN